MGEENDHMVELMVSASKLEIDYSTLEVENCTCLLYFVPWDGESGDGEEVCEKSCWGWA